MNISAKLKVSASKSATSPSCKPLYNKKMIKNYYSKPLAIIIMLLVVGCSTSDNEIIEENTVNLLNGLVGKFNLNGNANDSSQSHNNGLIIGTVLPIQDRNGITNSAMSFDELEGFIDVGNVPELKLISEISISVWVNANGNQNEWETIVNKWQTTGTSGIGFGYYLGLNPNGLSLRWNISSQIVEINSNFPINEWVHIVVTFNNQNLSLFINGILIGQEPTNGVLIDNNNPFRIGQQSDINTGAEGFNGAIDDVYIYNRVLNSKEIIELYNN